MFVNGVELNKKMYQEKYKPQVCEPLDREVEIFNELVRKLNIKHINNVYKKIIIGHGKFINSMNDIVDFNGTVYYNIDIEG